MEVWQTSNLRRLRLGEEKKERKKKERINHSMKIYMVSLFHRATINNYFKYGLHRFSDKSQYLSDTSNETSINKVQHAQFHYKRLT